MIPPLMMIDDVLSVTECGVNSLKMNALVLSKMATKRLELGASKCYQLHVGKTVSTCPSLQVDSGLSMEKASKQRYLGDIISTDTKIDANIKMRYDKGLLINNEIISILREVNLGNHFFEIAFMLHSSLLINGILYSTEALFKLNNQHTDKLMSCERDLLCKLWDCPRSVPTEALYIDGNITPLKFILMGRRLMFYWSILNKPKTELVRQVFDAMSEFPHSSCWYFF